jgi:cyclophilin family peptidyl-prolyl cis-trans isomerase
MDGQQMSSTVPMILKWMATIALMLGSSTASLRAQDTPGSESQVTAPGLHAEYLYNGINRPARITVISPRSFGSVTLVLMDFDGHVLAEPIDVQAGIVDLAERLPAIWDIRRTAYLQMFDREQPVGSALVLQPMLSRLVPMTEVTAHPVSGKPHARIVDWVEENDLPPPVLTYEVQVHPTAPAPQGGAASTPPRSTHVPAQRRDEPPPPPQMPELPPKRKSNEPVERIFTGLRMYSEHDVILRTTHGDIRLAMKPDEAPNTVWNFLELCRGGFYRDVEFHRIVPLTATGLPFVIQAGDPSSGGDGGPGYWLPIENSKLPHDFGVISMARSDDPDSNGSQFFICLSREGTARLDGQYCAFGYAVDGVPAIVQIAHAPLADVAAGRAANPPVIRTAELIPAPPRLIGQGRPDQRITPEMARTEPKSTGKVPR